ncbi:hypothetical protein [Meiothermus hypogaeus]|uniref:N-acetyltransferase domain-containing protein n=1 Tax=Meiothermus hypogaeus NBRC 106114 TaxID=1227553 RepID=A0A511QYX9_9DEIN|nr:hypothetical protein [Meiothermus hypogaeus]GEM82600.1 hypothetical protein MHY01S_07660 [Meiothermus hypogaeus NBRC 106114]
MSVRRFGGAPTWSTARPRTVPLSPRPDRSTGCSDFQTQPHLRGRGLYKAALRYLAGLALSSPPTGGIYIDTYAANLASRRGILSVGFQPCGVARTYIAGVPKLRWWKWGYWQAGRPHPGLPPRDFTRI